MKLIEILDKLNWKYFVTGIIGIFGILSILPKPQTKTVYVNDFDYSLQLLFSFLLIGWLLLWGIYTGYNLGPKLTRQQIKQVLDGPT